MAVVMATGVSLARLVMAKAVPNVNVSHTPPPPGNIVTPPGEKKDTGRNR